MAKKKKIPFHCKLCKEYVEDKEEIPPIFCMIIGNDDWEEEHIFCDTFKISKHQLIDYLISLEKKIKNLEKKLNEYRKEKM